MYFDMQEWDRLNINIFSIMRWVVFTDFKFITSTELKIYIHWSDISIVVMFPDKYNGIIF